MKRPGAETGSLASDDRRYQRLVDAITDYAIYMLDPGRDRDQLERRARERFKGYAADEIIGQHFSRFYTHEDRAAGAAAARAGTAADGRQFEAEGWRVRKDGTPLLGPRGHRSDPRSQTAELVGLRQDHPRPDRAQGKAEEALRRSEEQFRLLVQGVTDYAIYHARPAKAASPTGTPAPSASRATRRTRSSASISRASTPKRIAPPACRPAGAGDRRRAKAASRARAGACARTARVFWAHVVIDPIRDARRAS